MYEFTVTTLIIIGGMSAIAFEWVVENFGRVKSFRGTEVGSTLEGHSVLRLLYDIVFIVWWATSIAPVVNSVGALVAVGLLGGGATVGWDMFVHWFVHKVKSAKSSAVRKIERAQEEAEEKTNRSVESANTNED